VRAVIGEDSERDTSASAFLRAPDTDVRHSPRAVVLCAIALAGFAAAGFSVASALTSDHLREPEVQAALIVWVILASWPE
jgi:hypothetical protein